MQQKILIPQQVLSDELLHNMDRVKRELNSFETKRVKSVMFRCRCNYMQHGEVSSKYFFNIEKRNYVNKTMYSLRKRDGNITKDYGEILSEQHNFYSKLYTKDDTVKFSLSNRLGIKLNERDRIITEQPITKDELFDAMMTLRSAATPGCDGLTVGVYRTFWKCLVDPLLNVYQKSISTGKLNRTARQGIINLIPKKNKDDLILKSWHPITILNNCYKIFAKLIANRLRLAADYLIGKQQTGFVPGRSLTSNVIKTREILCHLNKNKLKGVVAIIDFEKCFDRISHEAIRGVFQYFGFGDQMVHLIMLLFQDIYVYVHW